MLKRTLFISAAVISSAFVSPALAGEATLTLKNYVGKITVNTEPGADLKIESKNRANSVDFDRDGDELLIDGNIKRPDSDGCKGYYGKVSWSWNDKKEKKGQFGGYKNLDQYPDITITGPETLTVVVENSIPFGAVGNIGGADIKLGYCGRLTIGDINGPADLRVTGSGDLVAGNIGDLMTRISGSGDFDFGDVDNADIKVSGSGNVEFGNANAVTLSISGSGDVEMEDIATSLFIKSGGSGDVSVTSLGEELTFEGGGSSDISIDDINGRALIKVGGSSDVDIDDGELETLIITASGGSDVRFGGTAKNAELTARGGADIYVSKVTGDKSTRTSGGGDIDIGN